MRVFRNIKVLNVGQGDCIVFRDLFDDLEDTERRYMLI